MDFAEFATRNKEAEARIAEAKAKGGVILSDEQFLALERWVINVALAVVAQREAGPDGAPKSVARADEARQAARLALTGKE